MSILAAAVEAHARRNCLELRDIFAAAYFKKYGKPMPENALSEDVRRWNAGEHNLPYLYDMFIGTTH